MKWDCDVMKTMLPRYNTLVRGRHSETNPKLNPNPAKNIALTL